MNDMVNKENDVCDISKEKNPIKIKEIAFYKQIVPGNCRHLDIFSPSFHKHINITMKKIRNGDAIPGYVLKWMY